MSFSCQLWSYWIERSNWRNTGIYSSVNDLLIWLRIRFSCVINCRLLVTDIFLLQATRRNAVHPYLTTPAPVLTAWWSFTHLYNYWSALRTEHFAVSTNLDRTVSRKQNRQANNNNRERPSVADCKTQVKFRKFEFSVALRPQKPYELLGTWNRGRPPRLSHSSWALQ